MQYTQDPVTRRLGLFGSDGYFFTEHPVEQGGFTRIRRTGNGNIAGFEVFKLIIVIYNILHIWYLEFQKGKNSI
jgi:hypothetical protein